MKTLTDSHSKSHTYRLGIIGTSPLVYAVLKDIERYVPRLKIYAIASRSQEKRTQFQKLFPSLAKTYENAHNLATDPEVDLVYIATPNSTHASLARLCLENHKHIICEKPFACSAKDARSIFELASTQKRFCMEALWTRFFPAIINLKNEIQNQALGHIELINMQLGFPLPSHKLSAQQTDNVGGGVLLDLGVYLVSLCIFFLGKEWDVVALSTNKNSQQTETQATWILKHATGTRATLTCSHTAHLQNALSLAGSKKTLTIENLFLHPYKLTTQYNETHESSKTSAILSNNKPSLKNLVKKSELVHALFQRAENFMTPFWKSSKTSIIPYQGAGYHYQFQEVVRCLDSSKEQSPLMPWDETLKTLEILDHLRQSS